MLELSEIIEKEGHRDTDAEKETVGITDTATVGRDPHTAEVAAQRVVQKLLLNSSDLGAPVVLACLHADGYALQCVATNFGAVRAATLRNVRLAYCVPPLAETPITPASAAVLDGALAVVRRGAVPVSVKAQNVQDAGAVGLVLINSDDHAWLPFVKTGEEQEASTKTHIPIVIVPKSAETALSAGALTTLLIQTHGPESPTGLPLMAEHGSAESIDARREPSPVSSSNPEVPPGQLEPLPKFAATTIQNGDRPSHLSAEQPNNQRLGPNQAIWPSWTDAASTAAILQSSVVALEGHCQRLSTRVQILEDNNSRLRNEVTQQQQQQNQRQQQQEQQQREREEEQEQERADLAAEVTQWMTTSNRVAQQLETVTRALEEATATAVAAASESQKRVQFLEDENSRLGHHIAQQQQQHRDLP